MSDESTCSVCCIQSEVDCHAFAINTISGDCLIYTREQTETGLIGSNGFIIMMREWTPPVSGITPETTLETTVPSQPETTTSTYPPSTPTTIGHNMDPFSSSTPEDSENTDPFCPEGYTLIDGSNICQSLKHGKNDQWLNYYDAERVCAEDGTTFAKFDSKEELVCK